MARLVFFNTGWMDRYQGLNNRDVIRGGGGFVREYRYGHEIFNFLPWDNKMYGYVEATSVDIQRIAPRGPRAARAPQASSVPNVLVIWTARNPSTGGTYIVGWYQNATVYAKARDNSVPNRRIGQQVGPGVSAVGQDIGVYASYYATAAEEDCHLLLPEERTFAIPRQRKGGMGQANVWYADDDGMSNLKRDVLNYVRGTRTQLKSLNLRRKYGSGGEKPPHRRLKHWCAANPLQLGLQGVLCTPGATEYEFICGDLADVVFDMQDNRYAVVEVKTDTPEVGAHQVLKYRTLLCAKKGLPVGSDRVKAVLVAWQIPESVRRFCNKYDVAWFEHRVD